MKGSIHICHHRTGSADSEQGSVLRDRVRERYLQLVAVASGDGENSLSTTTNAKTMDAHGMGCIIQA